MTQKDYYKILQIDPKAEADIIDAAYRRLLRKYHPDINQSKNATSFTQDLNEAYRILKDPIKRAEFDLSRTFRSENASKRGENEWQEAERRAAEAVKRAETEAFKREVSERARQRAEQDARDAKRQVEEERIQRREAEARQKSAEQVAREAKRYSLVEIMKMVRSYLVIDTGQKKLALIITTAVFSLFVCGLTGIITLWISLNLLSTALNQNQDEILVDKTLGSNLSSLPPQNLLVTKPSNQKKVKSPDKSTDTPIDSYEYEKLSKDFSATVFAYESERSVSIATKIVPSSMVQIDEPTIITTPFPTLLVVPTFKPMILPSSTLYPTQTPYSSPTQISTSTPYPTLTPNPSLTPTPTRLVIQNQGQEFQTENLAISITGPTNRIDFVSGEHVEEMAKGVFLVLPVRWRNTSPISRYNFIHGPNMCIVTGGEYWDCEWDDVFATSGYYDIQGLYFDREVNLEPGQATEGWILFDVPKDLGTPILRIPISNGESIDVVLQ